MASDDDEFDAFDDELDADTLTALDNVERIHASQVVRSAPAPPGPGPSRYLAPPPRKPVYKDETDVSELAQLKRLVTEEKLKRTQKEGEATMLRTKVEKSTAEHEKQLAKEHARNAELQAKVAQLERLAAEQETRYKEAAAFARQEHQSSLRQKPATVYRAQASSQRPATPKAKPKGPKGFKNSFYEPKASVLEPQSSPSRPNLSPVPLAGSSGKGKSREASPHLDIEEDVPAGMELRSRRDEIISFLFAHRGPPPAVASSLHAVLNLRFPPETDQAILDAHGRACQDLFAYLGAPAASVSSTEYEEYDRIFIGHLIGSIVRVIGALYQAQLRAPLILAIQLLQDVFFRFSLMLFHQTFSVKELDAAVSEACTVLARIVKEEHYFCQAAVDEARKVQQPMKISVPRSRVRTNDQSHAKGQQARIKAERTVQPVLEAALRTFLVLAWRPDDVMISNFDALLRSVDFVPVLLDSHRPVGVASLALDMLWLLSTEGKLFRTILAIPLERGTRQPSANRDQPSAPSKLAFIESMAVLLLYKAGTILDNRRIHQSVLSILSTLCTKHVDGIPLLGTSSTLFQRLVVRNATDAALLLDAGSPLAYPLKTRAVVTSIDASLRLLYMLLMSESSPKSLGAHLRERSDARDWFISGVGRMACADTPDWLEDEELLQNLDQLAELAMDLLADVLSSDEIDEMFDLCRDDEPAEVEEEEDLANENVDEMEG